MVRYKKTRLNVHSNIKPCFFTFAVLHSKVCGLGVVTMGVLRCKCRSFGLQTAWFLSRSEPLMMRGYGTNQNFLWYKRSRFLVYTLMCESLSPIPPKTLANAPKDFGMVPQRLWDGKCYTIQHHILYHRASYNQAYCKKIYC